MWNARPANSNGYPQLDFIEQNDYSIMNTDQPTHINLNSGLNCSLIDLTLCFPAIAHKCVIEVTGDFLNSDHCLILAKINSSANPLPSQWSPRWSLNRADWISFYQLCDVEITMNLFSTDTHLFQYRLNSTIFSIAEKIIPTTKPCGKLSVSWWNKNCQIAINSKKHALNRMLKTRHPTDIVTFKRTRAKAKKIVNETKQSCWQIYCSSISSNAKLGQIWSTVRKFTRQQTSSHFPPLQQHGITSTNDRHKANMLANQFQTVSGNENFSNTFKSNFESISHQLQQQLSCCSYQKMEIIPPFNTSELEDALAHSNNSAVGGDKLNCEMLKHIPNHCLQILLLLFNRIWFTGEIPPEWLHSMIVPLHKPNTPVNLPQSYRPISLTIQICKLMERMVAARARLRWYLEKNNILNKYQSGFRKRRRPIDHLLNLHDTVYKALANQRSVLAVFIDIEKAFDMVHKDTLLLKLLKTGIQDFMFNFLRSFLSNRTFQVRVSSTSSQIKILQNGVPQGSVLSPLLFAIMINDLPSCFNSSAALFADDLCFWEMGTDIQHLNNLTQASLNNVEAWCETNEFKISGNKSAAVSFTKKRKNKNVSLMLYNQTLELKKQVKYLGIIFQDNGIYSAHASYVQEKCLKRINILRMLKGSNWGMLQDALPSLYRALIRPIIEYGMEIYFNCSDSTIKIIETLQHECLRICTGALRSIPIDCLQHYCNEMPLKIKFQQLCLYYRAHLSTFTDHPLQLLHSTVGRKGGRMITQTFVLLTCKLGPSLKTLTSQPISTLFRMYLHGSSINQLLIMTFYSIAGKNNNPSIINAFFFRNY